jgi:hypothetical protein
MPKHDDPAELVRRLIKALGSKAEAKRRIDAAKVRGGSPGRPLKYFAEDAQVLTTVEMLGRDYRRRGVKLPKRRALIKEAIHLQEVADGKRLGKTKDATIHRISRYSGVVEMFEKLFSATGPEDGVSPSELREHWASVLPPDDLEYFLKKDPSLLYVTALWFEFNLLKNFERVRKK